MRSMLSMLVCAVLIAAATAGCGRSKTVKTAGGTATVTEKGDTKTVTFEGKGGAGTLEMKGDEESGTITTDKGTVTFGAAAGASEDEIGIPFYPGAKTEHMGKIEQTGGDQGKVTQVYLTTPDSVDKVKAFYQDKLAGAKIPMEISTADSRMVQMVVEGKAVSKSVVITRGKDDKETQIGLMRADKPE